MDPFSAGGCRFAIVAVDEGSGNVTVHPSPDKKATSARDCLLSAVKLYGTLGYRVHRLRVDNGTEFAEQGRLYTVIGDILAQPV